MRKNPVLDIDNVPVKNRPGKESINALLNTALALSLEDDFPNHILVEERAWLKNTMNIDLDDANRSVYAILQDALSSFKYELCNRQDVPDSYRNSEVTITNFATAVVSMNTAVAIAKKPECLELLKKTIEEYYQEDIQNNKQLKQAFRVTGIENFLIKYNLISSIKGVDQSRYYDEYSISTDTSESDTDW